MNTILYMGVDKATHKRVWGYARLKGEYNYDYHNRIHIFFGSNDGILQVRASVADQSFYNNLKKKKKLYETIENTELGAEIKQKYSEYILFKKLKYEGN